MHGEELPRKNRLSYFGYPSTADLAAKAGIFGCRKTAKNWCMKEVQKKRLKLLGYATRNPTGRPPAVYCTRNVARDTLEHEIGIREFVDNFECFTMLDDVDQIKLPDAEIYGASLLNVEFDRETEGIRFLQERCLKYEQGDTILWITLTPARIEVIRNRIALPPETYFGTFAEAVNPFRCKWVRKDGRMGMLNCGQKGRTKMVVLPGPMGGLTDAEESFS